MMLKNVGSPGTTSLKVLLLGILLGLGFFLILRQCIQKEDEPKINRDYIILTTQLQEMSKMIVLEQNFSSFQQHHGNGLRIAGQEFGGKDLILYSTARAQLSYDLKQMKVEVDSVGKRLIIKELPAPKLEVFPEVHIHMMHDNLLNRYNGSDLAALQKDAREKMVKEVRQKNWNPRGHEVLLKNLHSLFVLARTLGYTLEDQTQEKLLSTAL